MSDPDTKQTTDPLQRLRDLALAELGPRALPSERTDIMMWAAEEIGRLRAEVDRLEAEVADRAADAPDYRDGPRIP